MAGHSKWAQIKRQKGANDVKRGALFTKLGREITVAARQGGGDPDANFRLRIAIQRARAENMPMDNIQRAIQRGVGGGEGTALDEVTYEGYGPNGVAMLVQAMTDNRNRTVAEVRNVFNRAGGSLGEAGSVGWIFEQVGSIVIELNGKNADDVALVAIDAGAEDVQVDGETIEVVTKPENLEAVRSALESEQIKIVSSEINMQPKTKIELDEQSAMSLLKLIDRLEDLDDVQTVYTNADIPDSVLEKLQG